MLEFEGMLDRLQAFDAEGTGVLSVYLQTAPRPSAGPNASAQLTEVLRPLRAAILDEDERKEFDRAAHRARELCERLSPLPRAVAIFTCPPRAFETVIPLATMVPRNGVWTSRLYLAPLIAALDEHERAVVVLMDKARARIFQVCMGRIEELESFTDDVPGRHREGRSLQRAYQGPAVGLVGMGYDSAKIQRHHEWHVRQHIDRVLRSLARSRRTPLLGRIFIAGPVEAVSELRRLLPTPLRRRVSGELSLPLIASPAEVLRAVTEAQEIVERGEELALVEELVERSARSRLGPTAVAEAVADGQVHLFVYGERTSLTGRQCGTCGWILVDGEPSPAVCPRCDGELLPPQDLVDLMMNRVLDEGGRVEEVRGEAADLLAASGGVGALIRYVPDYTPAPS